MFKKIPVILLSISLLTACQTMSATEHRERIKDTEATERLTVGTVQSQVKEGMSGGDVATVLGAPNVVSTDENGQEVWIYDKISTESAVSASGHNFFGSSVAGASTQTQKTLTVIIKFDEQKKVRDIAYHASTF